MEFFKHPTAVELGSLPSPVPGPAPAPTAGPTHTNGTVPSPLPRPHANESPSSTPPTSPPPPPRRSYPRRVLDSLRRVGTSARMSPKRFLAQMRRGSQPSSTESPPSTSQTPTSSSPHHPNPSSFSSPSSLFFPTGSPESRTEARTRCRRADTPIHDLARQYDDYAFPPTPDPPAPAAPKPRPVYDLMVRAVVDYVHCRIQERARPPLPPVDDDINNENEENADDAASTQAAAGDESSKASEGEEKKKKKKKKEDQPSNAAGPVIVLPPPCFSSSSPDEENDDEPARSGAGTPTPSNPSSNGSVACPVPSLSNSGISADHKITEPKTPPELGPDSFVATGGRVVGESGDDDAE